MGTSYLQIVLIFSFGIFIEITCSRTLQATGNMIIPMFSQLIGAVTNIILDPIMIFGLFGFPAMGIKGAAIATVIGQICAMTFVLVMFHIKSHEVHLQIRGFKLKKEYVIDIYKVGFPVIIMNAIGSVTTTILNGILMGFSSTAVAIFGIYFKLQSFVFMPVFGLTQGAMPILGYNFGANNKKRFMHTLKLTLLTSFIIMSIGTAIFWLLPAELLALFDGSPEMIQMGIYVLRILSLCFIPAAIGITLSTMFQSIGHGFKSLVMSLLRQLVLIIPCAWLFATFIGLDAVWFCYPIAEIVCAVIFMPLAVVVVKKTFENRTTEIL
ncbi:MAG: MATE family efflux transporter, partial [Niameybacter sp.]